MKYNKWYKIGFKYDEAYSGTTTATEVMLVAEGAVLRTVTTMLEENGTRLLSTTNTYIPGARRIDFQDYVIDE